MAQMNLPTKQKKTLTDIEIIIVFAKAEEKQRIDREFGVGRYKL